MDFLLKFFEVIYKPKVFVEIAQKNYILPSIITFIILTITFNSLKIALNYDKYKEIMINQMEQNLDEINKNLKKQDLTYEERQEKLENYKKIYLASISLEIIILTEIAKGIFLQPVILLVQAFAFSLLFPLFHNYNFNFRSLFSILIYSKTFIILGSFIILIISIMLKNPLFSLNLSNLLPYELVSNNTYLKTLRNTLYHVEPFSVLSLIYFSIGLNKVFNFKLNNAIFGVLLVYICFLILNALFFVLFFK